MAREIQSAASRGASNFDWLPHAVLERFRLKGKLSIVESMDWVKPRRLIVAGDPERPADSWSSDGGGFGAQLLARINASRRSAIEVLVGGERAGKPLRRGAPQEIAEDYWRIETRVMPVKDRIGDRSRTMKLKVCRLADPGPGRETPAGAS